MENLTENDDFKNKLNRAIRKALLARIVKQIQNGEFSLSDEKRNLNPSRKEYISPAERSSNNYGYMESSEMEAGTPNVW